MIQGFLFNGVHLHAGHVSTGDHEDAVQVEAYAAQSALVGADLAAVAAGLAAHGMIVEAFEEASGSGKLVERGWVIHLIHYS